MNSNQGKSNSVWEPLPSKTSELPRKSAYVSPKVSARSDQLQHHVDFATYDGRARTGRDEKAPRWRYCAETRSPHIMDGILLRLLRLLLHRPNYNINTQAPGEKYPHLPVGVLVSGNRMIRKGTERGARPAGRTSGDREWRTTIFRKSCFVFLFFFVRYFRRMFAISSVTFGNGQTRQCERTEIQHVH